VALRRTRKLVLSKVKGYVVAAIVVIFITICIFAILVRQKEADSEVKQRPNIILMVIDALRPDHLPAYGYHRDVSPTIDAIAAEGVVFERAIAAAPWTQPSIASLFCGKYPGVHRVLDYNLADRMRRGKASRIAVFDDSFITLAEVLQENGYATAGFTAIPLLLRSYGYAQGFDHYVDVEARADKAKGQKQTADMLHRDAIEWLKQRDREKPFFMYFQYADVHGSYYARDEFVRPLMEQVEAMPNKHKLTSAEKNRMGYIAKTTAGKIAEQYKHLSDYREFWSALYDAGIREMDYHIATLVERLKQMNLWDDTYVIITADHGEELCEHGRFSHGVSLYHTELSVPLILRWPGVLPAGERVGGTAQLIDLMPTLIEHLHLPEVEGLQGRSLVPDIFGQPPSQPVMAFSEGVKSKLKQWAVYYGDWKVIVDGRTKRVALFNIAKDPQEKENLAAKNPEKLKMLVNMVHQQVQVNKKLGDQMRIKEVPLTPQQYQRLKSLGYVE
jgi:arylsulfatase A-like enzyme